MATKRLGLAVLVLGAALASPGAATEYVLDLADGSRTFLVDSGSELTFKITNRLPGGRYEFDLKKFGLLRPLSLDSFERETAALKKSKTLDAACKSILDALAKAGSGNSESAMRAALTTALTQSPNESCTTRINSFKSRTEVALDGSVRLEQGQRVELEIRRLGLEGRSWTYVFSSGQSRLWLSHYGFSFLPDEDERYFTKGSEDTGLTIARQADRGGADFEPTIAFSYIPSAADLNERTGRPHFTAGLGADLDKRLVFAGLSWIVGDNVSLFVGAAGHEQTRLKGIYEEGQALMESLTPDQLVDETFALNAIVGIGFRFSSNPFKKAEVTTASTSSTSADKNETIGSDSGNGDTEGSEAGNEGSTGQDSEEAEDAATEPSPCDDASSGKAGCEDPSVGSTS